MKARFAALATLRPELTRPWRGVIYRSATPRYAQGSDLLSGLGSARYGGRWNPPGLAAVYGSLDPETAMAETLSHFRYYQIPEQAAMPRLFVAVAADLAQVLDLRDAALRRRLRLYLGALLRPDWRAAVHAGLLTLAQQFAAAAAAAGCEALLVPSLARVGGANLVVFPQRLGPGASLRRLP